MEIFSFDSYKKALRSAVTERREQFGSKFTFERMAIQCGVQKTYLSKVLNGDGQLSSDQLFAAGEFLKLTSPENEFLLLLREAEISQSVPRRVQLMKRVRLARAQGTKSESALVINPNESISEHFWEYYTDFDTQLVHLFLTVPEYAEQPKLICRNIGISNERLDSILIKLTEWGIISFKDARYVVQDPKVHLSEGSPAFLAYAVLTRLKTIEKLKNSKLASDDNYFFSVVFSAEDGTQSKLKRRLLNLLKEIQVEVAGSKSEQVYQMNIDFFRWS